MREIWWEVTYRNGLTVSQQRGASYEILDRSNISSFLLRDREGPIVELIAEDGRSGSNLVVRNRTVLIDGFPVEVIVLGWIPQGPIYAIDADAMEVFQSDTFRYGDSVFYPPMPMSFEQWVVEHPTRIINPDFERVD